jgi:hypothetical protein
MVGAANGKNDIPSNMRDTLLKFEGKKLRPDQYCINEKELETKLLKLY